METIDPAGWNRLAGEASPLMSHEWLLHLERSGSITPDHGWQPAHLTATEEGQLVAAVPLYIHDNSWGEFVFDFAFAEVAAELGASYYPKLVGMSPASPSPAFQILTEPGRADELAGPVLTAIEALCREEEIPVLQFNFVEPAWAERLRTLGMVPWEHHGYTWFNEGFAGFDDYLARFRKNQRRNIRRERESMERQGISLEVVSALEAPESWFSLMTEYYLRTNAQFGPYAARFLTPEFFAGMPTEVRRHVWFVAARERRNTEMDTGPPLALALLLRKGDRVLGRYWGTREYRKDLHFNVCYYAPIEWAIQEGITEFDPGMGSEHKVRRGFRSVPTFSLHRFFDPHMQAILEANMDRINGFERAQITALDDAVPYK